MTPEVERSFNKIVDCISCEDGGVSLVRLKQTIAELDRQAQNHDPDGVAAFQVLRVVHQFARLIELANSDIARKQ